MSLAWRRRRLLALGGVGAALATNALTESPRVAQATGPVVGMNNYTGTADANADGVQGYAVGTNAGVFGRNNDFNGTAVFGAAPNGTGAFGESVIGTGAGGRSSSGRGLHGESTSGYGVQGVSQSNAGVWGKSNGSVAVFAESPNSIGVYASSGGSGAAVYAYSAAGTGAAVYGKSGSNAALWGESTAGNIGVYGAATTGTGVCGQSQSGRSGLFYGPVEVYGSFTVIGGSKNAGVQHPDGTIRRMYSIEGPESWFEDVGTGQLTAGRAQVWIDADFAVFVQTDAYQVFLTPEGDCKGLYVTGKTPTGFEVRELQGGTSSLSFSYRIVAKRKDITAPRLERIPNYGGPTLTSLPQAPAPPSLPDLMIPDAQPTVTRPSPTPTSPATAGSTPTGTATPGPSASSIPLPTMATPAPTPMPSPNAT
jgi:hypothetical protein